MADYRTMFDASHIGAWHLPKGKDAVVTIEKVVAGTLRNKQGSAKKPIVSFVGKSLTLPLNKTNGRVLAGMFGPDTDAWKGKQIALYATTTDMGGQTVDCVRIRPVVPTGKGAEMNEAAQPTDEELERRAIAAEGAAS